MSLFDANRIDEVFVQMIDKLDHPVFERPRHAEEVERREMLHILAQTDAPGMRTDWDIEFGRHKDNGKVLIHTGHSATVQLENIDGLSLKHLLKHDAVMDVFASGNANFGHFAEDAPPAKVVRRVATHLQLEVAPAVGQRLFREPANLLLAVAKPALRGRVCGIALLPEQRQPLRLSLAASREQLKRLFLRQGIVDVSKVDGLAELRRLHPA